MTKEDIKKAATEYANEACRPLWRTGNEQVCMVDFIEGAQWRINSVWHANSVDPELPDEPILYVDRNGSCGILRKGYFNKTKEPWITVCSLYRILIWAYIKDLTPNKE